MDELPPPIEASRVPDASWPADMLPPPAPIRVSEPTLPDRVTSRTWPQRLLIAATFTFAFASFGAAGVLYAGQRVIEDRNLAPVLLDPARLTTTLPPATESQATVPEQTAPPETFPQVEPQAMNFLITGADNDSCVDPDSPYAPAFGDRSGFGERSDTIMVWRVNPSTSQVAVLSFPRDLYVPIAGSSQKSRINSAYERDNPQKLIDTIGQNFGIAIDHFVQVDFCAFRTLVTAVGGVTAPFSTPIRDPNTGLNVPEAGCFTFDGDHALAYVRSRKLLYLDANGEWKQDPTSDLGRISRQQDFLRRTVAQLLAKGAYNPSVASGLIETLTEYVVTDQELTPRKMLEFAGVLAHIDPSQITTYQINATRKIIQGQDVLVPAINGDNMQAVLAVFRGEATLADAPEQILGDDTVPGDDATPATTTGDADPTSTTLPTVHAEQNIYGIVPDPNVSC